MEAIRLSCEARVGGERVIAQMVIPRLTYNNPEAMLEVERHLRVELAAKIVEKFPPKITAERVSDSMWRAV